MTSTPRPSQETIRNIASEKAVAVAGAAREIAFSTPSLPAQHGARVVLVDLRDNRLWVMFPVLLR